MKFIEKFQFITHDVPHLSHVEQAQKACEAGAKWIQYRCLTKNDVQLLEDIHAIATICDDWGTTLIVTDHYHLCGKADIQGFHIEDMDADFVKIRAVVGPDITLGGSSNTIENLLRLKNEGADYAGCGPFADTKTKPNDFKHLGIEGYTELMHELNNCGISFPVLAVGGVQLQDVEALMKTGVYGVAASSAINDSDDFEEAYVSFYNAVGR